MAAVVRTAALRLCQHEFVAWMHQRSTVVQVPHLSAKRLCLPWSCRGRSKRVMSVVLALQDSGAVLLSTKVCQDGSIMFKFGKRDEMVSESSYAQKEYDVNSPLWSETEPAECVEREQGCGASGYKGGEDCDERVAVEDVVRNGCVVSVSDPFKADDSGDGDAALAVRESKEAGVAAHHMRTHDLEAEVKDSQEVKAEDKAADSSQSHPVEEASEQRSDDASDKDRPYTLFSASAMLPHADKVATGGEDAFFMANNWIGVADGVGGWAMSGVDAGLYSRELMSRCSELAEKLKENGNPKEVLKLAHSRTFKMGSATAIVAVLRGKTLEVANVGDSGFVVIRDGKAIARSTPMQYAFNFPHQLGMNSFEEPDNYEVPVQKGDVIVVATDGLFDNLFENQIVEVVDVFKGGRGAGPKVVANFLATLAQQVSKSESGSSPFAVGASRAVDRFFTGGKPDDITVVVSYVT